MNGAVGPYPAKNGGGARGYDGFLGGEAEVAFVKGGEDLSPVVEKLFGGVATAVKIVGDFSDAAILEKVAEDSAHQLLQRGLGARHSHGTSGINADTFEGCCNATVLGTLGQWYLVEGLREVGYNDIAPAGDLAESRINVGHYGGLGFTVLANISEASDQTETTTSFLCTNNKK